MASLGRSSSIPPRTCRELLSFGGVAFEVLADERLDWRVPEDSRSHCVIGADPRAVADALCSVRADSALPQAAWLRNEVRFAREAGDGAKALLVRGRALQARVEALGSRRYAVSAAIAPSDEGYLALLRGVSAAIVHAEGGLVLHAAGLVLDGQATLFIGPSGAGKSTALKLTEGGRCFAHDHVAIVPGPEGWFAWGLPGGTAAGVPPAGAVVYPLKAVLRVRQGAQRAAPGITALRGASALFALRESVEWADDSPGAEEAYLRATMELFATTPVASIHTVLGRSLNTTLTTLLGARLEA